MAGSSFHSRVTAAIVAALLLSAPWLGCSEKRPSQAKTPSTGAVGKVITVQGRVTWSVGKEGQQTPLKPGDPVHAEWTVHTDRGARLTVLLKNGHRFTLSGDLSKKVSTVKALTLPPIKEGTLSKVADLGARPGADRTAAAGIHQEMSAATRASPSLPEEPQDTGGAPKDPVSAMDTSVTANEHPTQQPTSTPTTGTQGKRGPTRYPMKQPGAKDKIGQSGLTRSSGPYKSVPSMRVPKHGPGVRGTGTPLRPTFGPMAPRPQPRQPLPSGDTAQRKPSDPHSTSSRRAAPPHPTLVKALTPHQVRLRACLKRHRVVVVIVRLVIAGRTGRVLKVVVAGRSARDPLVQCLAPILKRAAFPRWAANSYRFSYRLANQ